MNSTISDMRFFSRYFSCLFATGALMAANTPPSTLTLSTSPQVSKYWRIDNAWVDQSRGPDVFYLQITNTAESRVMGARFYAEFFDARGRRCMSTLFSEGETAKGAADPFMDPGESRTLVSGVGGVGFSVLPATARVYLFSQADPVVKVSDGSVPPVLRPPLLGGGGAELAFRLHPQSESRPEDLVLALVSIGDHNDTRAVSVLQAANDAVRHWFDQLLRELHFISPAENGSRRAGLLFILLRYVPDGLRHDPVAFDQNDGWLAVAVSKWTGADVPPVSSLQFSAEKDESTGLMTLTFMPVGSNWDSELWKWDFPPGLPAFARWNDGIDQAPFPW